ncbi:MAG TPA: 1,4-alpha-glucan branching protein [Propionibacteriaceae bacterium]
MAGVAEIHTQARLTPNKLELMRAWLPTQAWFTGDASDLAQVGQFRFVDPAGAVGIQIMLVTSGGILYQVPLSYRDAPLAGAEDALVGTMEHSVLGTRWTYDALADPVYQAELLRTIVEGDTGAGVPADAAATTPVHGSGAEGVELVPGEYQGGDLLAYGPLSIHVPRHPDEAEPIGAQGVLTAELALDGDELTLVLAELRRA